MNDDHNILGFLEAAVQMCSVKVFLKKFHKIHGKTTVPEFLF